jgi:hypothetical protein
LSSSANAEESVPVINTAPEAADAFMNSLRVISFDTNPTSFLLICKSETPECLQRDSEFHGVLYWHLVETRLHTTLRIGFQQYVFVFRRQREKSCATRLACAGTARRRSAAHETGRGGWAKGFTWNDLSLQPYECDISDETHRHASSIRQNEVHRVCLAMSLHSVPRFNIPVNR